MRALGGRGKHIQICLCLAQSIFFELPRPVNEATKYRVTIEHREEAPARDRRERTRRALVFNRLDSARNTFELCPTNTASWEMKSLARQPFLDAKLPKLDVNPEDLLK